MLTHLPPLLIVLPGTLLLDAVVSLSRCFSFKYRRYCHAIRSCTSSDPSFALSFPSFAQRSGFLAPIHAVFSILRAALRFSGSHSRHMLT